MFAWFLGRNHTNISAIGVCGGGQELAGAAQIPLLFLPE